MLNLISISLLLFISSCISSEKAQDTRQQGTFYSLLCLGDSYTVGESVSQEQSFPYQLEKLLNKDKKLFMPPTVVAKTGWTTDEMLKGLRIANLEMTYDFVTLCIGVNDQYRGRSASNFIESFEVCLNTAIRYAQGNKDRVVVLSIPDWGVTPYAKENDFDPIQVAKEIDAYNHTQDSICRSKEIAYIEITDHYRKNGALKSGYAKDGLHPSSEIYNYWANELFKSIHKQLKN